MVGLDPSAVPYETPMMSESGFIGFKDLQDSCCEQFIVSSWTSSNHENFDLPAEGRFRQFENAK